MNVTHGRPLTAEITDILVARCGLDAAAAAREPTASLEELGMDSLALLELQAVVADRYRVQIPDRAAQLSIPAVADLVARQGVSPTRTDPAGTADPPAPGARPGHTENSIVIAARLSLVWEITNDVANWTDLFTEYASVEILEQDGPTVRFRLAMHPDENGTVWSWVSERTTDWPNRQVRAQRIETGPFEYMRIHWRYDTEPDGTRMTWVQDFSMRPEAPVDNEGMTERINLNSRIQLKIIKHRIEQVARKRAATTGADDE